MKKLLIGFLVSLMLITSAFAIDYDKIRNTLDKMGFTIYKMRELVTAHEQGFITVGQEQVNLTDAQKQALIDKYNELKQQLEDLYKELP